MPSYESFEQLSSGLYHYTDARTMLDLFLSIPGIVPPETVLYAGSYTDISLVEYFGAEKVTHIDHMIEAIRILEEANLQAVHTVIPDYHGPAVDLLYTNGLGQQGYSDDFETIGLDDPQLNANRVYSKCVEMARYLIICDGDGGARRVAHNPNIRLLGGIIEKRADGEIMPAEERELLPPEKAAPYLGDCVFIDGSNQTVHFEHPDPKSLMKYGWGGHVTGHFMFEKLPG